MPEYLAPGVYVEEVSFRAKSIEGVSTSVTGFIGPTRYGPIEGEPELLTSFNDFERIFGGIDRLQFEDQSGEDHENYMAHSVRAFFDNGGSKLYVVRTYTPRAPTLPGSPSDPSFDRAFSAADSPVTVALRARFPGRAGNMRVVVAVRASANVLVAESDGQPVVRSIRENDVLLIRNRIGSPVGAEPRYELFDVDLDGEDFIFDSPTSPPISATDLNPDTQEAHIITLSVRVLRNGRFETEQAWNNLSPNPLSRNSVFSLFTETPESRTRYLIVPFAFETDVTSGAGFVEALVGRDVLGNLELSLMSDQEFATVGPLLSSPLSAADARNRPRPADLERTFYLTAGTDGDLPNAEAYRGREAQRDPSGAFVEASGLEAFADVEEISMVAAPGYSFREVNLTEAENNARWSTIVQALITHCQYRMRYRVTLLDSPNDMAISEVRAFRGQFDSTHAALYYPWITVLDPLDPDGRREINVPPSGFVTGICARTDVLHGVFKAPANEVVLGAIGFEKLLNKAQQDILNPEGINAFRFFEGRGFRLWGARTISSDPEWKYLSVRRYFAYLEHSIDRGTQWAVFENNNEALWANIRRTVEDFLFNEWRNGALMGTKPEEAYFVRCDRSTMTQNDLDNGRLICLIGVSVVKPAEFVIFRIGQWTADAKG
jgi:phage tail sheath protein FI